MKTIITAVILIFSAFILKAEKYIQPMPIDPLLSASFAELRANHFHAGIDLTTSGTIGVKVRAVADGYVSRIKVSPYGYGYALYITHKDGNTTVYGHLSAYASKIDTLVVAEQYRQKSFEIDYFPKPNQLPVKCGEVVAYSGNSGGSGGPHLHFEVRDTKTEEPLNPLAYLPTVIDTQAPTIYGAKLYIADDVSQIKGECRDFYFPLKDIAGKTFEAYGNVRFGIHATDYFIAGHRPCGVVEIKLFDNNKLIYSSRLERFAFDETRYVNSHIDFAEYQNNKRYVQKSFVEPNNRLRIYGAHSDMSIAEGERHQMRYELRDFAGNKSELTFTLIGKRNRTAKPRKHEGYFVEWNKTWTLDTLNVSVLIPHESLYCNEYLMFAVTESKIYNQTIYAIGNNSIPLHKSMTLTVPVPQSVKKLISKGVKARQVFVGTVNKSGALSYVGGKCDKQRVTVQTKSLGDFVVAIDTISPNVFSKNTRTQLVSTNSVMIGLTDDISGVAKYNCYIDGEWKLFDYDYKNRRLISKVGRLGLNKGEHTIEAVVEDACGNESRFSWKFSVK